MNDSTMFIQGPFGCLIPRFPPHHTYVYLLHFSEPYFHARHYLGVTCNLEARLQLHRNGNGARLMEVVSKAGIGFDLVRLWQCETWEEGRALERKLKRRHDGVRLCPICQGRDVDTLVLMRRGHWPFTLYERPGKRQPMRTCAPPRFVPGQSVNGVQCLSTPSIAN